MLYNCILSKGMVNCSESEADVHPHRLKWKDENMNKAMDAVSSKEMSLTAASRTIKVQ